MKFSILALGAAVAGISSQCIAQIQIDSAASRPTQTRLISQNQDFFESQAPDDDEADYYAPSKSAEIDNAQEFDSGPRSVLEKPVSTESTPLPQQPAAPMDVLALTPEVGMVPVCWQNTSGCPTPNPVANYLMMGGCTQGLWDTHAIERARQCAHIQKQLHGHNRYRAACAPCASAHAISLAPSCDRGPSTSACAQNSATPFSANPLPTSALAAATPPATSPFVGELQAGLPVVDVPAQAPGWAQMSSYGSTNTSFPQPAESNVLPSGQSLLQLPSDVPTVPAPIIPAPIIPAIQPPNTSVLPALPLPNASPVVASRQMAPLR